MEEEVLTQDEQQIESCETEATGDVVGKLLRLCSCLVIISDPVHLVLFYAHQLLLVICRERCES